MSDLMFDTDGTTERIFLKKCILKTKHNKTDFSKERVPKNKFSYF